MASFIAGGLLLAATAHATVISVGGYGSAHSFITIAIAGGVALAAILVGSRWVSKRLALWLVLAVICGELFGLIATAERIVVGREETQAPLHQAQLAHAAAASRVAEATAAVSRVPTTSKRLEAATTAKVAADRAVLEKSDGKACKENCRKLLEKAADDARDEVDAARAELADKAEAARGELQKATAALAGMRAPASATPFADRLSVSGWAVDLLQAALGALGANGLAFGLLAFAGHAPAVQARRVIRARRRRRVWRRVSKPLQVETPEAPALEVPAVPAIEAPRVEVRVPAVKMPEPSTVVAFRAPARTESSKGRLGGAKIGQPAHFLYEVIDAAEDDARLDFCDVLSRYAQWCSRRGFKPMPEDAFASAFVEVCRKAGIAVVKHGKSFACVGVKLVA